MPGRSRIVNQCANRVPPHCPRGCQTFFAWHNGEHRHRGIAMFTPADVHHGRATELGATRARALAAGFLPQHEHQAAAIGS